MKNLQTFLASFKKGERGFTLLLAALIASIVLSLASSIFDIAQKELILSSAGRDSQFAFYAADTAAECALYWDVRFQYFATSSPPGVNPLCDGQTLTANVTSGSRASGTYTMEFSYQINTPQPSGPANSYCADVSVSKSLNMQTNAITSVVHADGFSTACASVDTDPQVLERSVELHY